jgi:glycosyltransferase involved in cell wall biosynthesis
LRRHESIVLFEIEDPAERARALRRQIAEFQPDWVLVSSEDVGHALLREAHHSAEGRVIYLAHTPQFFPFGPASWNPEPNAARMVASSAGVVTIGRRMADYVRTELGREAAVIHPPIYGVGPFPNLADFERGLVVMINPCAVKGISIFLETARRLPHLRFGAAPGWGTTSADRRALAALPNVEILPNRESIDDLLASARILLMPSLWYEGFGLIVMEAMLRGIPVVASDSGGLPEAKQATGCLIPVAGIEGYRPVFDELGMPEPIARPNDAAPWVSAIEELLSDCAAYARESAASREAAHRFVAQLDGGEMERFLLSLGTSAKAPTQPATVESLSPERRALLLERLRRRGTAR